MKVIAVLASYNEERFIGACLEHYYQHGIEVFLLDNGSTDSTIEIAKTYLGKNLIDIRHIRRDGQYDWLKILREKENVVDSLDADWFMHADPDEIRFPPQDNQTLLEAIIDVDREGYNAINFMEYVFIPTGESPQHDHANFQQTMRWYYPFLPRDPHRMNLWKKRSNNWKDLRRWPHEVVRNRRWRVPSVDLCASGGHLVNFPGVNLYPIDFKMRHYLVLSLDHAIDKYVKKTFKEDDIENLHGWRGRAEEDDFILPSTSMMKPYIDDNSLDPSEPMTKHLIV